MTDDYRVRALSPDGDALVVPAGTSLLVVAERSVCRDLVLDAAGEGVADGEGALVVATEDSAEDVRSFLGDRLDGDGLLRVIECGADEPGLVAGDDGVVQRVETPRNLTDIGIGFSNAIDAFEAEGIDRVRTAVLSLSVVLTYVDRETAYRFCQTLTRRIDDEGHLGLFCIHPSAHDDRTLNTFRRAFDGAVEFGDDGTVEAVEGLDEE